jgi:rSAM/selenodomain-associated transferase 1
MKDDAANSFHQAIVFVKAPILGRVKTRLEKQLDFNTVLEIYKCTTADVIETVRQRVSDVKICYYPPEETDLVKDWLGDTYDYEAQVGNHLGERMKNAFISSFSGNCSRAILVGTDLPGLSHKVIGESFKQLAREAAVLGPTYDGGYYLIGFREDLLIPGVFDNMPWGTPHVFENTMRAFGEAKCTVHILPKLRDIDTYEDLIAFGKCFNPEAPNGRRTMAYLKSLKLI